MRVWIVGLVALLCGACSTTPTVHLNEPRRCPGFGCLAPELGETRHGHVLAFGGNVLVGGLTAGVARSRDDGSFWEGFVRGAVGGAGTFAGKWVAGETFTGAGALGRAVAAGGASVSRNAADGRPILGRLILPVGPLRLRLGLAERDLGVSVDAFATGALLHARFSARGGSFDLSRSLDSGVPVFLASDWTPSYGWHGRHLGGAVILRGDEWGWEALPDFMERVVAHERIHVLQYDQANILWGEGADTWVLDALGVPERVSRWIDLSLPAVAYTVLHAFSPGIQRPLEFEADLLARTD